MLNHSVRKIRIATDVRKKISIGYKTEKGLPKAVDHFVTANPESGEVYYPEIEALYGSNPNKLFIAFPSNNIQDFYNDNYNLWQGNQTKRRTCDGVNCLHVVDETIEDIPYKAGTDSECVCKSHSLFETDDKELKKIKCKLDIYMTAYILHPKTLRPISPIAYLFTNHSINSANNIYTELSRYSKFVGYPFVLSTKKIKKADSTNFVLIQLHPYIDPDKLIEYNLKATDEIMNVIANSESNLLSENASIAEVIEDAEIIEDVGNSEPLNKVSMIDYISVSTHCANIQRLVLEQDVTDYIKNLNIADEKILDEIKQYARDHIKFIRKAGAEN